MKIILLINSNKLNITNLNQLSPSTVSILE